MNHAICKQQSLLHLSDIHAHVAAFATACVAAFATACVATFAAYNGVVRGIYGEPRYF